MKQRKQLRSDCPISFSLEIFGDAWSLLIIRDIMFTGKQTFNEFLGSGEGIARTILADRLRQLEQQGLIAKSPHPTDRRKEIYTLTSKGQELKPVLLNLSHWGTKHRAAHTI